MDKRRPLGVKIIAGILFLDALILFSSAAASLLLPHQAVMQIEQFLYGIPYFRQLPIGDGMGLVVLDLMLDIGSLEGVGDMVHEELGADTHHHWTWPDTSAVSFRLLPFSIGSGSIVR